MMKKLSIVAITLSIFISLGVLIFLNYFSSSAASGTSIITLNSDWSQGQSENLIIQNDSIYMDDRAEEPLDISGATFSATINQETASNVADGDEATMWSIGIGVDCELGGVCEAQYLTVDLGDIYPITRLSYVYLAPNFNIDYSLDGVNFDWLCGDSCSLSPATELRYIRFDRSSTDYEEWGIYEIYLYTTATGTHTTAPTQIDGTADIESWDSFDPTQTAPSNTSVEYEFRSSSDGTAWSTWSAPQAYGGSAIDISSLEARRYLQVRATLETTDSLVTPQIDDYTINYTTTDAATCDDGIQNGDEEGVDCGGSCDPCPLPEPTCDDFDHLETTSTPSDTSSVAGGDSFAFTSIAVDASGNPIDTTHSFDISPATSNFSVTTSSGETGEAAWSVPPDISPGDYTVTITSGCGGEDTIILTVPDPPAEPTCDDGIQNGDETGVDCGGSCNPCETCDDGIQNQDEEGVDCGGVCDPCPVPAPDPTCFDGIQNQGETGVDCGGPCAPCDEPDPEPESTPDPVCNYNGIQDNGESGIDCGGGGCLVCDEPTPAPSCILNIDMFSPKQGDVYSLGDELEIIWNIKNSSYDSLAEAYNIRYKLYLSLDNGKTFNLLVKDLIDTNFATKSEFDALAKTTNWKSTLANQSFKYLIPGDHVYISDQAVVRVVTYRTTENPLGCFGDHIKSSPPFTIKSSIENICDETELVFTKPAEAMLSATDSSTTFYYPQISDWLSFKPQIAAALVDPDIYYTTKGERGVVEDISQDDISVEPSDFATLSGDSLLVDFDKYARETDFSITAYDEVCDRKNALYASFANPYHDQSIKLNIPNGGEVWIWGKIYEITWDVNSPKDPIDRIELQLSTDSGETYPISISKDIEPDKTSYFFDIPQEEKYISKQAKVRVIAYDKMGRAIMADTSDEDFSIIKTSFASYIEEAKDHASAVSTLLAALAALSALALAAMPPLVNMLSLNTFSELLRAIPLLGKRKKRDSGIIYDAKTGLPLPYARVLVFSLEDFRMVKTAVSDKDGRFGLILPRGGYSLQVQKEGYKLLKHDEDDLEYENNYFGEDIEIDNDLEKIEKNIPLFATSKLIKSITSITFANKLERTLVALNIPLLIIGSIFSILAILVDSTTYNIAIIFLYVLMWARQIYVAPHSKAYGLTLDQNKKLQDLCLVRATKDGKLTRTVVSDRDGRYAMLLPRGTFRLLAQKPGYTSMSETINTKTSQKAVTKNIYLEKNQKPSQQTKEMVNKEEPARQVNSLSDVIEGYAGELGK